MWAWQFAKMLHVAKAKGWTITQILNTHHHRDHTGGNDQVIAATRAKLLAHAGAKDQIDGIDRGLKAGDVIKVGRTVELECLDTPGHTMSHICVRSRGAHCAFQRVTGAWRDRVARDFFFGTSGVAVAADPSEAHAAQPAG